MEQHGPRQGHPAITRQAVHSLFKEFPGGAKVLGLIEDQFAARLDKAQAYADRITGDTWHPSFQDPDAQRRHAMADPFKSGEQNLHDIRDFISKQLALAVGAHIEGDRQAEWQYLGAAIHALQDSYSNAHMFRSTATPGDPRAPVEAINNFDPIGADWNTHTGDFDKTHATDGQVNRPSDQAAVAASVEVLKLFLMVIASGGTFDQNVQTFQNGIAPFFQGNDPKVHKDSNSNEFKSDKNERYENESSQQPAAPNQSIPVGPVSTLTGGLLESTSSQANATSTVDLLVTPWDQGQLTDQDLDRLTFQPLDSGNNSGVDNLWSDGVQGDLGAPLEGVVSLNDVVVPDFSAANFGQGSDDVSSQFANLGDLGSPPDIVGTGLGADGTMASIDFSFDTGIAQSLGLDDSLGSASMPDFGASGGQDMSAGADFGAAGGFDSGSPGGGTDV